MKRIANITISFICFLLTLYFSWKVWKFGYDADSMGMSLGFTISFIGTSSLLSASTLIIWKFKKDIRKPNDARHVKSGRKTGCVLYCVAVFIGFILLSKAFAYSVVKPEVFWLILILFIVFSWFLVPDSILTGFMTAKTITHDEMEFNPENQTANIQKSVDIDKIKQNIEAARMYDSNYKTGDGEFCIITQIEEGKWALEYFVKSEITDIETFVTEEEAYEKLNDIIGNSTNSNDRTT